MENDEMVHGTDGLLQVQFTPIITKTLNRMSRLLKSLDATYTDFME
ncbi:hypothetical protein AAKU55_001048 [Oxalobacteraceae bacterium GrIS 1.11]